MSPGTILSWRVIANELIDGCCNGILRVSGSQANDRHANNYPHPWKQVKGNHLARKVRGDASDAQCRSFEYGRSLHPKDEDLSLGTPAARSSLSMTNKKQHQHQQQTYKSNDKSMSNSKTKNNRSLGWNGFHPKP
jgi:hypothetical protein